MKSLRKVTMNFIERQDVKKKVNGTGTTLKNTKRIFFPSKNKKHHQQQQRSTKTSE